MYCDKGASSLANGLLPNVSGDITAKDNILDTLDSSAEEHFWGRYIDGFEGQIFPQIPVSVHEAHLTERARYEIILGNSMVATLYTVSSIIRTGWALLVSQYTESQDVVIVSSLELPSQAMGGTILFPVRFRIRQDGRTEELLQSAKKHADKVLSSQKHDFPHTKDFVDPFSNSILLICTESQPSHSLEELLTELSASKKCALVLRCELLEDKISISAMFDPQVVRPRQTRRILDQLGHILKQISGSDMLVGDLDFLSPEDRQEIGRWNSRSALSDECIHALISKQAQQNPAAMAVNAHDGNFTYGELESYATRLAAHLIHIGVKSGNFVPTLFEKSKWTQVGILAILKAGAAFVMLDPSHPPARNQLICRKANACFALASAPCEPVLSMAVPHVITLSHSFMEELGRLQPPHEQKSPCLDPRAVAYLLFTSGSTGQPKGAILEHRSFAAASRGVVAMTHMSSTTRTLQHSSYSFGAAIVEIIATLVAGGCVVVLSDTERLSNVAASMVAYSVNWAFMTPSFARTVNPADVPCLRVLATGGEGVTSDIVETWASSVSLYTVYGSAEQSSIAAMAGPLATHQRGNSANVGSPFAGCYAWIVQPDRPEKLAPVGCVGELVLEGALVARGYIDEVESTAAAFPKGFSWRCLFPLHQEGSTRFYRTGDLVRYAVDGTLEFVARRNGYIKLRGQRIELGEIESQLKAVARQPYEFCVEVVVPKGETADKAVLVAFVALGSAYTDNEICESAISSSEQFDQGILVDVLGHVEERLAETLPAFMIPRFFFPLQHFPVTSSGKIARKILREQAAQMSVLQLAELSLGSVEKKELQSDMERYLRSVWVQLLGVPEDFIGANDSFFRVGGDSLKAIKLFQRLRRDGYNLNVTSIVAAPTLSQMARNCSLLD
ncbi:Nonribosomal peptide synthetase dtxS1 [Alternaria tenuissima]|uniref:Nonribosomal peptide synthetase dtxS1 n=2 Tax=Alternaria alternata complex TaxID=187734 RepID=A0A4Q4MYR8_ALTAL|nr:Nonribosomal peptide synthetase dtxS1 [Alternaria alternata]RYN85714.1 Nonribosomal peptide synthetase dtxS1 [Alternaria tenuissima]RYO00920.1 Nonribosomal peptide synthetase dtxS1 [Alternaria tenuissima]RYO45102.1 Nonribosomal peptide synthetase [Alternaria tenuissima]